MGDKILRSSKDVVFVYGFLFPYPQVLYTFAKLFETVIVVFFPDDGIYFQFAIRKDK